MSDPVTNIDIEDVLASIRRLVSEGEVPARPQPTAVAVPAPAPVARAEAPDCLLLTPAFRVDEPAPAAEPPLSLAGLEVAREEPVAPEPTPEPAAEPAADRTRLEATIAELEAAVSEQPVEWEPDGSEETPVIDWASAEMVEGAFFTHRGAPPPAPAAETGDPEEEDEDEIAPAPLPLSPMDLGADIGRAGADEDDDREAGLIDEEMLRALVADVVRQELQGPLGERITRNVRKLVRREIYRVLSSQEFD